MCGTCSVEYSDLIEGQSRKRTPSFNNVYNNREFTSSKKETPPPKQKKTASLYPKLKWHWKRRITFSSQLTIIRLKVCRSQRLNIASDSQDTSLIRIDFQGPGFWFGSIGNIHSRGFRQKRMPYDLECGEYPWNCRLSCIMLHHFSRYESLLELAIDA